jgi:dsRNA-specific ribonuclease
MIFEKLYEEVLLEESIKDWLLQNKNILKQLFKELSTLGLLLSSAGTMGIYVSSFLTKNFPNLPEQTLEKIAQFISTNPQIFDLIKS